MFRGSFIRLIVAIPLLVAAFAFGAEPARKNLPGHVPAVVRQLAPKGRVSATNQLSLALGLPLRNRPVLDDLLRQIYDPQSTNFHKFLTTSDFTARFGPTEGDYQAAIKFAESNGLRVSANHPNRVVLDVEGNPAQVEQAFHVTLRTYAHPTEPRDFFAPDAEPSVPENLSVITIEGLTDYQPPRPLSHKMDPAKIRALGGTGPGGAYAGNDFRNAYAPGSPLNGAGQAVGLLEFSAFYSSDITSYENTIGLSPFVPVNTVVIGHPAPSTANNSEVALDIEVAIAMAPGLSQVIVYETRSSASSMLSRMANDNLAKQLSSSWTWSGGPSATTDNIFLQMAAQGQSYFQASGDSDAYTGTQVLDNASQTTTPVDSTNITCVGGTTLTMNGSGASWSSETVWNWNNSGQPNVGSGGGISTYYKIPYWQANVSMAANSGSTVFRNIPDVALTADEVYVAYNNGASGVFGGTSCAAPLWAGFCALVNQQAAANGGTSVGFLNPAIYAISQSPNYANCFHDTTTGNNIGSHTPGLFNAVPGYDLATGLGTPNGTNLINALAPFSVPAFVAQPSSQTVTNGANVVLSGSASGQSPISYRWLFNTTNLPAGGNLSGVTSNVLSITSATTTNAGSYRLVASNNFGSITSSVAVLTVVLPPVITTFITNPAIECGSNAAFSAAASGTAPLKFQWTLDGSPVSGATNVSFSLTNVHLPNHTVALTVTNLYGSASSNAVLAVHDTVAPVITLNGGNPIVLELGSAFSDPNAAATDICAGAVAVLRSGTVNTSAVGTNILTYTANDASGNTNTAVRSVIVRDTTPPTITWSFTNLVLAADTNCSARMPDVTGTNFIVASDLSGALIISQNPSNNAVLPLGTNVAVISVKDNSGNTSFSTNTITVRDQTPPLIVTQPQSQTNLVHTTATFAAAATACTPLSYQWFFGNSLLTQQTNSSLTISNVSTANAGNYELVATALGGSSTSAVATLTVDRISTGLALDSSSNPAGYNDSLNFIAAITPSNASGSIQFLTNGVEFDTETLVTGQATSTNLASLPRGTNLITAIYSGDASNLPVTNTLAQIITNHPPVAAPAFFSRAAGSSLNISIADLATNWTDVDSDTISLASFSVSTNGVTLTNNAGTLFYSNSNNVADQFTGIVSDGWGGTNAQIVTIAVTASPDSTPAITSVLGNADGTFTLNLAGAPGATYILETTADLLPPLTWQPITTNTLGTNNAWQFTDDQAANFQHRFYRVKLGQSPMGASGVLKTF
jgi:hypothetical protein